MYVVYRCRSSLSILEHSPKSVAHHLGILRLCCPLLLLWSPQLALQGALQCFEELCIAGRLRGRKGALGKGLQTLCDGSGTNVIGIAGELCASASIDVLWCVVL